MCREETGSGWEDFGLLLETVLLPSRIAFQSVHSLLVETDDNGWMWGNSGAKFPTFLWAGMKLQFASIPSSDKLLYEP